MSTNPKYDNDLVPLGYLKKLLDDKDTETKEKIEQIPRNYNSPPTTPYYAGSLLLLNGKIYKCIKSRLVGSFTISDWETAIDTNEVDTILKTIYDVNKLEYVEQNDGVIEAFYQDDDPSLEWTTDLIKSNHVSDLWTIDMLNCYQYEKKLTNPVTYGWIKVNVPCSLFDVVDGYRRIFIEQPTSYSKDDLWFGEATKIAINDSETFNIEDWENRDDFIESSVVEQEEYHKVYLLPKITEISRQTKAEIKKAIDEIILSVSQTYVTETEVEQYIDDVKSETAEIYTTQETFESQFSLIPEQITSIVENRITSALETVNSTMLQQTSDVFQMLFEKNNVQGIMDGVQTDLNKTKEDITSIHEYITFEGAKIILGKSTSQSKLIIENDIIKFMTGDNLSAYISENQLYITDSTILNKLQIGHWEIKPDKLGNLNTRWVGGN